MVNDIRAFVQARATAVPLPRDEIVTAARCFATLRRNVHQMLDDARDARHADGDAGNQSQVEQAIQTLAALAREADDVSRRAADLVPILDQLATIEACLRKTFGI